MAVLWGVYAAGDDGDGGNNASLNTGFYGGGKSDALSPFSSWSYGALNGGGHHGRSIRLITNSLDGYIGTPVNSDGGFLAGGGGVYSSGYNSALMGGNGGIGGGGGGFNASSTTTYVSSGGSGGNGLIVVMYLTVT